MAKTRILIVDDEQIAARELQPSLLNCGYSVVGQSDNGVDAIQKAETLHPDLILMNISLSGEMDGIETAAQIWARFNIPIIFLVIDADQATLERARHIGPFSYLFRPFQEQELICNIETALYKDRLEKNLRESEEKYRLLTENAADVIWILDFTAGRFRYISPSIERLRGYKVDEALKENPSTRVTPASWQALQTSMPNRIKQFQQGQSEFFTDELEQTCKNGTTIWVEITSHFISNPQNGHLEIVGATRNITKRKWAENALRESEARFRSLLQMVPNVAVQGYAMDGTTQYWNNASEKIYGYTAQEAIGRSLLDLIIPPEMRDGVRQAIRDMAETGQPIPASELSLMRKDGSRVAVYSSHAIVVGPGRAPELFCIDIDLAEQKQAQAALRESEEKYRRLFDNTTLGIFQSTPEGKAICVNQAFADMFGYASPAEAIETLKDIATDAFTDPNRRAEIIRLITADPSLRSFENLYRRKDGSTFIGKLHPMLIRDNGGSLVRIEGIIEDITALKQSEAELRKLLQAVEQSANIIMVTDLTGRIEYVNPKFVDVTGYSLAEAIGMNASNLSSSEHPAEFYENMWKTIQAGNIWQGEFHNRRKDGSLYWEDATISPVYDARGKPINFIAIKEDITARKQLEQAERDQRKLAEALRDTAMILNSTMKLDEVLDRILDNIEKLVPYDAAILLMIEGDMARTVRQRSQLAGRTPTQNQQFKISNLPMLSRLLETRQALIIPDLQVDPDWGKNVPGMLWIRSFASIPLEIRQKVVGVINLAHSQPDFFTIEHANRLKVFSSQAAVAIENAQLYEQSLYLATTDSLTGLHNRRYFFEQANLELERTQRYNRKLSITMIDIDHFKLINDIHGHTLGDLALHEIARRIKSCVRAIDIVARYGGEEFVVLMPETGLTEAGRIAERIRHSVSEITIVEGSISFRATLSLGIAETCQDTKNLDSLIKNADGALYAAKMAGRNRVMKHLNTVG